MHTTNYYDTFIKVFGDCGATSRQVPPLMNSQRTAVRIQYDLSTGSTYAKTSDDIVFETFTIQNAMPEGDMTYQRELFFSKGQPCLRASALAKKYGWAPTMITKEISHCSLSDPKNISNS